MELKVRAMEPAEISLVITYFHRADRQLLLEMGVYAPNLPAPDVWLTRLQADFVKPLRERDFYYTVWELDGQLIGHCNVSDLEFGQQAKMHLHMWNNSRRRKGMGTLLVKRSLAQFFEKLALKELYCEPYALNPAPNRTLARVGFKYLYTHETVPGPLNFHQRVTRWVYRLE